ncbi:COG4223 family protein [Oceaniglobus ichthyenteri]|uniref:COG4223 family protein n=1 Tax=Oceaniglobus ichthyenteri TaxID=2136177 RepID=UPI000F832F46|nr:mitofilin family membrane protein [Oceaniglobus ichthyenteri]
MAKSKKPRTTRSQSAKAADKTTENTDLDTDAAKTDISDDATGANTEPVESPPEDAIIMGPPDDEADENAGQTDVPVDLEKPQDVPDPGADSLTGADDGGDSILPPEENSDPDSLHSAADDTSVTPDTSPEADNTAPGTTPMLAPVPVEQPRIARGPGFLTLLIGGALAGAIGFFASEYDVFNQGGEDPVAALEARLNDQAAQLEQASAQASDAAATAAAAPTPDDIAALREEIANLPAGEGGADPALGDRLSEVETWLDNLSAQVAGLPDQAGGTDEAALSALEDQIATARQDIEAQFAARQQEVEAELATIQEQYQTQLAALEQKIDAQSGAIADATSAADAARESAASETRRITVRAALIQINAAIDSGEPFIESTSALETAGNVDVPPALLENAETGVATLAELQNSYPPAARAALGVSIRETSGGGALDRFGAFVRSQTGARSLDARDGDDPDAVLSRAEAALKSGDVQGALDQLNDLPEAGRDVMADWSARANARLAASAALADLSATTNSN